MTPEQIEYKPPFKVEVRPFIEGANPYQENKCKDLGSLNKRALLQEKVYLYNGNIVKARLGEKDIQVRSFIDIRTAFFTDNTLVYHPFVHWGLKDGFTGKDIFGYTESEIYVDPVHVFRVIKIFEALPRLNEDFDTTIQDRCDANTASQRFFFSFQLKNAGKDDRRHRTKQRKRIVEKIGRDKLNEIFQMMPPRLEEMIQTMKERQIFVTTRNLEREITLKRILPSEYLLDTIKQHYKNVEDFAKDLEETDGNW